MSRFANEQAAQLAVKLQVSKIIYVPAEQGEPSSPVLLPRFTSPSLLLAKCAQSQARAFTLNKHEVDVTSR